MKVNKVQLLAKLRRLLSKPDTRIKLRKLKICGQCTWDEDEGPTGDPVISNLTIYLDPRRDGRVRLVIHELLHIWMQQRFRLHDAFVYELEEAEISALDSAVYNYLHAPSRERELENWDRAIQRKLAQ